MPTQLDYNQMFQQIGDGIKTLADNTVSKYKQVAEQEADTVLANLKVDLIKWTDLLAAKQISPKDFEVLVNCDKDLVEMKSLLIAGLAQLRVNQFIESIFNLIVDVILKFVAAKFGI